MNITATDRKALIRLASSLPKGSEERKTVLAGLKQSSPSYMFDVRYYREGLGDPDELVDRDKQFRDWDAVTAYVRKLERDGYRLMSLSA